MDIFSSSEDPSSSSATVTNSDCDFDDVFGGPPLPRRSSSIHDRRHSSSGYVDLTESRVVFGDQSLNRDDFFQDIFRGDEYCRPRRLSVHPDQFATPISAARFSLGANSNKSTDPFHSTRFSSQLVKISESATSKPDRLESVITLEDDMKTQESPVTVDNNWSCRKMPLMTPIHRRKSKESSKSLKSSSSNNDRVENGGKENLPEESAMSKNAKKAEAEKDFSSKPEVIISVEEFTKIFSTESSFKCLSDAISESLNKNIVDTKTEESSIKADENLEEPYIDSTMENPIQVEFLIDELPNGELRLLKADDHHEAIQISDAKIQRWCEGKQGNIRSLLSTLQYVLWEESGWKPVALADIIEASKVKKAYQKALLCLHPDKLQQRGAATHKKYIAQVVFDTLQEAMDQFNAMNRQ